MAKRARRQWDAGAVRTLRHSLEMTQQQFAAELGVRQQTVSEWETGAYAPRGASERLLTIVAERAATGYEAGIGGREAEGGSQRAEAGKRPPRTGRSVDR